jgi:hypothetical protein
MIRSLPRSLFLIAAATMAAGAQVVHVERGTDIPALWRPDRPLYVKGDLGVPAERLDAFAGWLAANAPNWTVVLMRHARGETFRDATGTVFSGMDAVEHALGTSLPAATGFAEHTHPETAEKNGAYFILYLEERKLAYHASEAYDNRRLGEDHWIGNLDAAAITAMRGGGRVIDAAKDTVVTIDRELQRRIRQEAEARARDAERARRASEETAGDLANPPLARWVARLDAAERALAQADPEAAAITRDATGEIVRHIRALADHEDAPARIRGLEQQLDEVRLHDSSAGGRNALLGAREHLRAAGDAHARADSLAAAEAGHAATRRQVAEVARLAGRAATAGSPADVMESIHRAKIGLDEGSDISRHLDQAEARLRHAEAARQHAAALIDLDLGCIEAAAAALDDCDQHCRFIHEMIEATLAAYEAAPAASADLEREGRRIHALLPAATALMEELRHSWAPSALRPASADPSHPDPTASVTDHLQRAESALQAAGEAMAMAAESHRSGRILQAADLRDQAAAAQAAAEQTLRGIHEHAAAIAAAVTANTSRLGKLDHQSQHLDRAASDPQITRPALGEWAAARDLLETARTAVDARGPSANPVEAARLLDAADAALTAIEARFTVDRHLHEEVARSLDAADQEMNAARRLVHRSQTDQIPDSGETTRCVNRLTELESELAETRRLFALPHGDWQRLDQEADRITAEAARLGGRLRGELELAEQAVQAIHAAHAKVRAASAWRGDSGAGALQRARAGLSGGDYHGARELAAAAARLADQAVRAIEAEALMRLRQVQRQHEAARRRTRTSSFGSSSSFGSRSGGSGFSSRSSFSSRSGGSRSSFSSGSGTRRSGW